RHTRLQGDWSSDVCSSDLPPCALFPYGRSFFEASYGNKAQGGQWKLGAIGVAEWTGVPLREVLDRAGLRRSAQDVMPEGLDELRSEERRVGKEGRCGWGPD